MRHWIYALLLFAPCISAQTRVDYSTQVRNGPLFSDAGPAGSTLTSLCTAVGKGTLSVTKTWTAQTTQTLSCNLQFNGGTIQPASGQTVTITGPILAPLAQIFDQSLGGTVVVSGHNAFQQWWGNTGNTNFGLGSATIQTTPGTGNTAIGVNALAVNTSAGGGGNGANNTAVGDLSMAANTIGNSNTAMGHASLRNETTGSADTAVGVSAGESITTAFDVTCMGYASCDSITTGQQNTGFGKGALAAVVTGIHNTCGGWSCLNQFLGSNAAAFGYESLASLVSTAGTDTGNAAFGMESASSLVSQTGSTALGSWALAFAGTSPGTAGSFNTAVGDHAMSGDQTCPATGNQGTRNTVIGRLTLSNCNQTGNDNWAAGDHAAYAANTASFLTVTGSQAGIAITTANGTTAYGYSACGAVVTSQGNTCIGYLSLALATGATNTGLGTQTLTSDTTGAANTAAGFQALSAVTTGGNNAGLGFGACANVTTGNNNTCLGLSSDVNSGAAANRVAIGASVVSTCDNCTFLTPGNTIWTGNVEATNLNVALQTENGAANAIACPAGCGPTLATGLVITIPLQHSLQAGANTFAYNGGAAVVIKSHFNASNNIATAYSGSSGVPTLYYNGSAWLDLSQ